MGDIIQYFFKIVYTFLEKCDKMTKVLKLSQKPTIKKKGIDKYEI